MANVSQTPFSPNEHLPPALHLTDWSVDEQNALVSLYSVIDASYFPLSGLTLTLDEGRILPCSHLIFTIATLFLECVQAWIWPQHAKRMMRWHQLETEAISQTLWHSRHIVQIHLDQMSPDKDPDLSIVKEICELFDEKMKRASSPHPVTFFERLLEKQEWRLWPKSWEYLNPESEEERASPPLQIEAPSSLEPSIDNHGLFLDDASCLTSEESLSIGSTLYLSAYSSRSSSPASSSLSFEEAPPSFYEKCLQEYRHCDFRPEVKRSRLQIADITSERDFQWQAFLLHKAFEELNQEQLNVLKDKFKNFLGLIGFHGQGLETQTAIHTAVNRLYNLLQENAQEVQEQIGYRFNIYDIIVDAIAAGILAEVETPSLALKSTLNTLTWFPASARQAALVSGIKSLIFVASQVMRSSDFIKAMLDAIYEIVPLTACGYYLRKDSFHEQCRHLIQLLQSKYKVLMHLDFENLSQPADLVIFETCQNILDAAIRLFTPPETD